MDNHGITEAFPHTPYDIQREFMLALYETLEQRQIGLFESPTGTGKTLSMICATLKWLEDQRRLDEERKKQEVQAAGNQLPSWMRSFDPHAAAEEPKQAVLALAKAVRKDKAASATKQQHKEQRPGLNKPSITDDDGNDLSEFLMPNEIAVGGKRGAGDRSGSGSSSEDGGAGGPHNRLGGPRAPLPPAHKPQVIFCSRTHSQLSQFVGELHRTRFAESLTLVAVASRRALCINQEVTKLSDLAAINEKCMDLQQTKGSSKSRRTDASTTTNSKQPLGLAQLAHAKREGKKTGGCPYLQRGAGNDGRTAAAATGVTDPLEQFKQAVLSAPVDVEELASIGRSHKACPYYGSRLAVPEADIILAPYSALLSSESRSALGLDPEDSVLVFDEAHNLLDAINGAHGSSITGGHLASAQRQVAAYYERFRSVLSPANAQQVQLLLRVTAALLGRLGGGPGAPPRGSGAVCAPPTAAGAVGGAPAGEAEACAVRVNELLFDLGLDNINMFQLLRWMKEAKFVFKVSGYSASATAKAGCVQPHHRSGGGGGSSTGAPTEAGGRTSGLASMHALSSFMAALTNSDADGRIIIEPGAHVRGGASSTAGPEAGGAGSGSVVGATAGANAGAGPGGAGATDPAAARGGQFRFVLLNAARHFGRLLSSARAVVLASGTLSPIASLRAQLFPDEPPSRIRHFDCGHVVPAEQLLAVSIGRGPGGRPLDFRHARRSSDGVADEAGVLLANLACVVPAGMVVFAPSFAYLDLLVSRWRETGLLARLEARKAVFVEPRAAADVEAMLQEYAAALDERTGHRQQPAAGAGLAATGSQQDSGMGRDQLAATLSGAGSEKGGPTPAAAVAAPSVAAPSKGALLLCVMGGKLSEGINFGDDLGRCVVVLGMPYPNPSDPELQERMRYLDAASAVSTASLAAPVAASQQQQQQTDSSSYAAAALSAPQQAGTSGLASAAAVLTGAQYYEDLCFKAVNQAIGRVIRHRGDYAAIVLADQRWVTPQLAAGQQQPPRSRAPPVTKLPGWIRRSFSATKGDFGAALQLLARFFKARQAAGAATAASPPATAAGMP